MLRWAITFFIIAIVAAALGFYGISGTAADIAKFLALVFVVLMVISSSSAAACSAGLRSREEVEFTTEARRTRKEEREDREFL